MAIAAHMPVSLLAAAAAWALLSSPGAGTSSPSNALLPPEAEATGARAVPLSLSITSSLPQSPGDDTPSGDDEVEGGVPFSCENFEVIPPRSLLLGAPRRPTHDFEVQLKCRTNNMMSCIASRRSECGTSLDQRASSHVP